MDRIFLVQMDVEQQVDDVWLEAGHQKLDYENFMDDDEVTLHRCKDTYVTDIPGPDARDDLDHNKKTGCFGQSLFRGLVPGR